MGYDLEALAIHEFAKQVVSVCRSTQDMLEVKETRKWSGGDIFAPGE